MPACHILYTIKLAHFH